MTPQFRTPSRNRNPFSGAPVRPFLLYFFVMPIPPFSLLVEIVLAILPILMFSCVSQTFLKFADSRFRLLLGSLMFVIFLRAQVATRLTWPLYAWPLYGGQIVPMVVNKLDDDTADYYNAADNPVYYYGIIYAYRQPFRVYAIDGIISYVSVPVVAVLDGITGKEPSDTGIVVAMPQPHQSGDRVVLVAVLPGKPKGRRGRPRHRNAHPEGVGVQAVHFGLRRVGYRPCGSQSVCVIILAGSTSGLSYQPARSLQVGGRAIGEDIRSPSLSQL